MVLTGAMLQTRADERRSRCIPQCSFAREATVLDADPVGSSRCPDFLQRQPGCVPSPRTRDGAATSAAPRMSGASQRLQILDGIERAQ